MDENDLCREVERFKYWARTRDPAVALHCPSEWECDYPNWFDVYDAVTTTLSRSPTDVEIDDLLFVLARDHEDEEVLDLLVEGLSSVGEFVSRALTYPDPAARWQVAVLLGSRHEPEAVGWLHQFIIDSDEYVRRRALLVLQKCDPVHAEVVAVSWLSAAEEYSRLVALSVLHSLDSSHLQHALAVLDDDPSVVIQRRLEEIMRDGARDREV